MQIHVDIDDKLSNKMTTTKGIILKEWKLTCRFCRWPLSSIDIVILKIW